MYVLLAVFKNSLYGISCFLTFRVNDRLFFRPGGHGALIENLNDIDADVVFIKNIDNVVPDPMKQPTVEFKAILAGVLVNVQKKIFSYLELMDKKTPSSKEIASLSTNQPSAYSTE